MLEGSLLHDGNASNDREIHTSSNEHVHRFRVPPPNGPTSVGKCSCGEGREMFNSLDTSRESAHWRDVSERTRTGKRKMTTAEMRAVEESKRQTMMNLASAVAGTKQWLWG